MKCVMISEDTEKCFSELKTGELFEFSDIGSLCLKLQNGYVNLESCVTKIDDAGRGRLVTVYQGEVRYWK